MTSPPLSAADLRIDALVLAGRRDGEIDPLAGVENVPHKALLVAGGKPLIRRVIEALTASGRIDAVTIAAPEDVRAPIGAALAGLDFTFRDTAGSPASTALAALEAAADSRGLLVTTCDHALLTPDMIRRFLDEAAKSDAAAACVDRQTYEMRFPGSQRTFIKLKDLQFSGANLFWFAGARAKGLADFWRGLEANRKNPLAMARTIGIFTALAYLTGSMTKSGLEDTIRKRTKTGVRLIPLGDAAAAIDVDKPQDLDLVRKILALD
jgi:molybdopterin-guanine dinucleotide biosynthesis protein A